MKFNFAPKRKCAFAPKRQLIPIISFLSGTAKSTENDRPRQRNIIPKPCQGHFCTLPLEEPPVLYPIPTPKPHPKTTPPLQAARYTCNIQKTTHQALQKPLRCHLSTIGYESLKKTQVMMILSIVLESFQLKHVCILVAQKFF